MSESSKKQFPLYDFAWHGNAECKTIQSTIIEEPWGEDLKHLKIYLGDNFEIAKKNNKIHVDAEKAVWQPGYLLNKSGDPIWLTYRKNPIEGKQPWKFNKHMVSTCPVGVEAKSLEIKYTYPDFESEFELNINHDHIINDNRDRLEEVFEGIFKEKLNGYLVYKAIVGEIEMQKRRNTAIPQWYMEEYQFLIPLCLKSPNNVDLVAALQPKDKKYYVRTLLYPNQAYAHARSVVKNRLNLPHWIVENENTEENKSK